ncbi:MAG: type II toxin-antitoxin system VapC family toxin [Balneolaceae bacterium]|jgi:PIN domain nuclease of toxin-antitoxin system|nr:MAG: type II toxin-antitoxin system VapC family toxin [Balneolaceae bacterium]
MKKILIDSHILLWIFGDPAKLRTKDVDLIKEPSTDVITSIASIWELHIKASLDRLTIPDNFTTELEKNFITVLPIHQNHLTTLLHLPHHHSDPFDRMILAQAISEKIPLISYDRIFSDYPVELL